MLVCRQLFWPVKCMQENISVTHARNLIADDAGSEIQAMLSQLLEIYDVKTLVAHLNGLGEQHWSPPS